MGGRRSYSIKEIVSTSPSAIAKRGSLTKSLKGKDVDGITRSSVNLIPDHKDIVKIFIYSEKLLSTIKNKYKQEELKNLKEINRNVRIDWAKKKKRESFESNRIIDAAVIDSVSRVLKDRKK
jgi:hypothetical protein